MPVSREINFLNPLFNGSTNSKFMNEDGIYPHECLIWPPIDNYLNKLDDAIAVISPILCLIGFVGNGFGLWLAFKQKPYPRIIFTRTLYFVNLINMVFMLVYPVLDSIGGYLRANFWASSSWNIYVANYHFPISRTLICLSFGIYVLFAISQHIAIVYPYAYKKLFTPKHIMQYVTFCLLYMTLWNIPTRWWFSCFFIFNVCGYEKGTFSYRFITYTTVRQQRFWITYDILRETFTKFIPALCIIVIKIWSQKHLSQIHDWKQSLKNSSVKPSDISTSKMTQSMAKSTANVGKDSELTNSDMSQLSNPYSQSSGLGGDTQMSAYLSNAQSIIEKSRINTRKSQRIKDARLLLVLGMEVVLFLFPVSIFLIYRNISNSMDIYETDVTFGLCTLIEYLFVILTFYFNLMLDKKYRNTFVMHTKTSMIWWKKTILRF